MRLAPGGGGRKPRRQLLTAAMLLSKSGPCSAQVFLMLHDAPRLPGVDLGARAVATPALAFALRPCAMPVWKGAGDSWRSPLCMSTSWCRGGPLERAAARLCRREAGAVVAMHNWVRDLNVGSVPKDDRRIEVIANGLSLSGGMQPAVDTTPVSRRHQSRAQGAALRQARQRAHTRSCFALTRAAGICSSHLRLEGASSCSGRRGRARNVPPRVRGAVSAAFARRWSSFSAAGFLTAGSRLPGAAASVKTAAETSRARRRT